MVKIMGKPNPYEQMDELGGFPIIFGLTPLWVHPKQRIKLFVLSMDQIQLTSLIREKCPRTWA